MSMGQVHGGALPVCQAMTLRCDNQDIALILRSTKTEGHASAEGITTAIQSKPSGFPLTLSVRRHGDFPRNLNWSDLHECALRRHASPAP